MPAFTPLSLGKWPLCPARASGGLDRPSKPFGDCSWERKEKPMRNPGLQLTIGALWVPHFAALVPQNFPQHSSPSSTIPASLTLNNALLHPRDQAPLQGGLGSLSLQYQSGPHVGRLPWCVLLVIKGRWGRATTVEYLLYARPTVGPRHACSYLLALPRTPGR